jgi:hypothetical protein
VVYLHRCAQRSSTLALFYSAFLLVQRAAPSGIKRRISTDAH